MRRVKLVFNKVKIPGDWEKAVMLPEFSLILPTFLQLNELKLQSFKAVQTFVDLEKAINRVNRLKL